MQKTAADRDVYMNALRKEDVPITYMEPNPENGVLDILKNLPAKYRDIPIDGIYFTMERIVNN